MGLNEAAGYTAVAATALATGYLASPRPASGTFFLGIAFVALGLGLSTLAVKETREHARLDAAGHVARADGNDHLHRELSNGQVFIQTSFKEPALSAASQAGLVNNLNDGLAWGLFPILFAGAGLSVGKIGVLAALYPAVWGLGQLFTGALSDRWGRKWMIASGMWLQAIALGLIGLADVFTVWALAATLLGAGTAMVYPTLLAAIGDVAHPAWRARSVGVYRLWRDGGFAVGALLAGLPRRRPRHPHRHLGHCRTDGTVRSRGRCPHVRNASPTHPSRAGRDERDLTWPRASGTGPGPEPPSATPSRAFVPGWPPLDHGRGARGLDRRGRPVLTF